MFNLHALVCDNIGNITNFGRIFEELNLWEAICNLLSSYLFIYLFRFQVFIQNSEINEIWHLKSVP